MKENLKNQGTVLIMAVFVVALLAAIVMGMLQMNTEEIQLMRNQIYATQALATAEAGLNDAIAQLGVDSGWTGPIVGKSFNGDTYDVTVSGTLPNLTLTSTANTSQGYVAKVQAETTVSTTGPWYIVRIDNLRINE